MKTLRVIMFLIIIDIGLMRTVNIEERAGRKREKQADLGTHKKSGSLPIYDHDNVKKCGDVKKRKKQVYLEGTSNKGHDGSTEVPDKSSKHHRQDNYANKNKKKDGRKKTGFTKGFNDKYHLDEKKIKNNLWSLSESNGQYVRFGNRRKSKETNRANNLRKNQMKKIDRAYPGGQFVEITWHSQSK